MSVQPLNLSQIPVTRLDPAPELTRIADTQTDRAGAWTSRAALRHETPRVGTSDGLTPIVFARAGSPGDDRWVGKRCVDGLDIDTAVVGGCPLGRVALA
jgi:hypothetical protein